MTALNANHIYYSNYAEKRQTNYKISINQSMNYNNFASNKNNTHHIDNQELSANKVINNPHGQILGHFKNPSEHRIKSNRHSPNLTFH